MNTILTTALAATKESEVVDFKESFDVTSKGEWCEIIKDMVAMANSGGGILLIGVKDDGSVSGFDVAPILAYDPANVTNKMFSYTGRHFSGFNISAAQKDGNTIAVLEIRRVSVPLVFVSPGNYQGHDGKPRCAFPIGGVYFRHGAKSEPCTSNDLEQFLKREIDTVKEAWLSGIRKVVEAPEGAHIMVLPADATTTQSTDSHVVRIVDDPNAPAVSVREEDIFKNYPYDYRRLTQALRERYSDFIENDRYHRIRKLLEGNSLYCRTRLLNPNSSKSARTRFYNATIFHEFDKHYIKKNDV